MKIIGSVFLFLCVASSTIYSMEIEQFKEPIQIIASHKEKIVENRTDLLMAPNLQVQPLQSNIQAMIKAFDESLAPHDTANNKDALECATILWNIFSETRNKTIPDGPIDLIPYDEKWTSQQVELIKRLMEPVYSMAKLPSGEIDKELLCQLCDIGISTIALDCFKLDQKDLSNNNGGLQRNDSHELLLKGLQRIPWLHNFIFPSAHPTEPVDLLEDDEHEGLTDLLLWLGGAGPEIDITRGRVYSKSDTSCHLF